MFSLFQWRRGWADWEPWGAAEVLQAPGQGGQGGRAHTGPYATPAWGNMINQSHEYF